MSKGERRLSREIRELYKEQKEFIRTPANGIQSNAPIYTLDGDTSVSERSSISRTSLGEWSPSSLTSDKYETSKPIAKKRRNSNRSAGHAEPETSTRDASTQTSDFPKNAGLNDSRNVLVECRKDSSPPFPRSQASSGKPTPSYSRPTRLRLSDIVREANLPKLSASHPDPPEALESRPSSHQQRVSDSVLIMSEKLKGMRDRILQFRNPIVHRGSLKKPSAISTAK